ncbi:MAG TPA: ATP-binding cassette domain-containing protein [Phycisphaerales bacterium]|nr:ATP-binding cassette domain-containing protein [Phycisphaerales bacterium]HMP35858.1 ATP-binding cassette domain-containing protein [Phycisphaerales bacterium]
MGAAGDNLLDAPRAAPAVAAAAAPVRDRAEEPLVRVEGFRAAFGRRVVLDDVSFVVHGGEIVVLAGGSGCGKSTLLKHMIGLHRPAAGRILIDGVDVSQVQGERRRALLRTFGVSYQPGALFGSMSLSRNIELVMEEFTDLPPAARRAIALSKLRLVGLERAAEQLPSQVSGGMLKRAAIARAMAVEPKILFLDEPSAGLDPISSAELDQLILDLRRMLGMTFVVVTHELPSIFTIADRCVVLDAARKTKVADETPAWLRDECEDEWVRQFFNRGAGGESAGPPTAATPVAAGTQRPAGTPAQKDASA